MRFFKPKPSTAAQAGISYLTFKDFDVEITRKDIKRLYLRVSADGGVRISAPRSVPIDAVRGFVVSKQAWIRKQQEHLRARGRESPPEYVDGEAHYFGGEQYALSIREHHGPAKVGIRDQSIELSIRPGVPQTKRKSLIEGWYRGRMKAMIPRIIVRYEGLMGVRVHEFGVKRMRTRWGTCNIRAKRIWLNLELAKWPHACLEYVVVHEMTHLIEPLHNERFHALMDEYLPDWRTHKEALRRIPAASESECGDSLDL